MIDPAQFTRDLGGTWHRTCGTVPCPVCQPKHRKDQIARGIRTEGDRLFMHCKRLGCDLGHIVIASGPSPQRNCTRWTRSLLTCRARRIAQT